MDVLSNPETWIALLTLTTLEIVLGIDNVIFISVIVQRLPVDQRDRARLIGLGLAAGMRILLLLTISWIIGLTATVNGNEYFLHDGRARSLSEAILWHDGEAEAAREAFRTMSSSDRVALLAFLRSL